MNAELKSGNCPQRRGEAERRGLEPRRQKPTPGKILINSRKARRAELSRQGGLSEYVQSAPQFRGSRSLKRRRARDIVAKDRGGTKIPGRLPVAKGEKRLLVVKFGNHRKHGGVSHGLRLSNRIIAVGSPGPRPAQSAAVESGSAWPDGMDLVDRGFGFRGEKPSQVRAVGCPVRRSRGHNRDPRPRGMTEAAKKVTRQHRRSGQRANA